MRKKIIFLLFCLLATLAVSAQSKRSVQSIAELLEKSKVFLEYRRFRNDFEKMNAEAGQHLLYKDDYVKLNVAYNDIQEQYNGFLGIVKKDLSNLGTIRLMVKKPDQYALQYLDQYKSVVDAYQRNYLPIYKEVTAPNRSSLGQSKAVTVTMIIMGVELFLEIIDLIQSRKGEDDSSENYVLSTINAYFLKKMEMKPWSELAIEVPTKRLTNDPNPIVSTKQKKKKTPLVQRAENKIVAAPVYEQLNGWVEFNSIDTQKKANKMKFDKPSSKDIGVEVLKNSNGKIERTTQLLQIAQYQTTARYEEGVQFQLKTSNSGGMYVFALSSTNKVRFLYPYNSESLKNCDQKLGMGKDIGVLPASFVVGRDAKQTTTLPAPDCSTTPPTERYFTITAPMPANKMEQFCVLLTKSEIDMDRFTKMMEKTTGSLPERLAAVLGDKMVGAKDAGFNMKDHRLLFDTGSSSQSVLPVLFSILRK